jgi:DUF4097 and DUF4098 domain-containing protein YvlB
MQIFQMNQLDDELAPCASTLAPTGKRRILQKTVRRYKEKSEMAEKNSFGKLEQWSANQAKKRRGLEATPEPPLGGWRSRYSAPERRKEIFQLPVFSLASFRPIARKQMNTEYNYYLIFLPIVNTSLQPYSSQ